MKTDRLRGLCQRADALGAERLLNFLAILDHRYLLQVGAEGAVGRPVGERNAVAKGSGLTTMSAFCHFLELPFLQMIPACFSGKRRILPRIASMYKSRVIK
jgi:hypothetical protein